MYKQSIKGITVIYWVYMTAKKIKMIKVSDETHSRLMKHGDHFGETFDDVINKILDYYEKGSKK